MAIWTLNAILYLFDGEQGRLLVFLQGAEKRRFTNHYIRISPQSQVFVRTNISPLGQHVVLLVLPQLNRHLPYTILETKGYIEFNNLIPSSPQFVIVLAFVLEVLQPILRHYHCIIKTLQYTFLALLQNQVCIKI